jgi:hypothetical protein
VHRSRIGVVLVDHPAESHDAAVTFWSGARGGGDPHTEEPYTTLPALPGGVELALQRLGGGDAARIHLDIETDDVTAEVSRLVGLGASVRERREEHAVLADPGGVVFCVVPVQTGEHFTAHATTWP